MATLLQTATGFEDLLRVEDPSGTFRYDRIFEGEGWTARRRHERHLKVLRKLETELRSLLAPGEAVEYVARSIEHSLVDSQFLLLWHVFLNQRALVLTDRRLLLIQIDLRGRPKALRSQIRREAIAGLRGGSMGKGMLTLRTRDGRGLTLIGLSRADRRVLRERLSGADAAPTGGAPIARGREHLCPHCRAPAAEVGGPWPPHCRHCRGEFKSPARAGWLSLAFPGLGDLYLGNRAVAAAQIAVALPLWGVFFPLLITLTLGHEGMAGHPLLALGLGAGVFLTGHGLNALVARRIARKGLYPARAGGSSPSGP